MKKVEEVKEFITKEELISLQGLTATLRDLHIRVGELEISKTRMLGEYYKVEAELNEVKKELNEKYGKVSVNLNDGSFVSEDNTESNEQD